MQSYTPTFNPVYSGTIGKWSEAVIGDKVVDWLQTYQPAFILRSPNMGHILIRDVKKAVLGRPNTPLSTPPTLIYVEDVGQLHSYLSELPDNTPIAADIETSGRVWYDRPHKQADLIVMLALCWTPAYALILDDQLLYDDSRVAECLNYHFSRLSVTAHNGKFDAIFLRVLGIELNVQFDTILADACLNELGPHGLKELAVQTFGIDNYEDHIIRKYTGSVKGDYSLIPFDELALYCAWDVACTLELRKVQTEQLKKEGQWEWPFSNLMMQADKMLLDAEWKGVYVDRPHLERLRELFSGLADEYEKRCWEIANRKLNVRSYMQLSDFIYGAEGLGLIPMGGATKSGHFSTGKAALEEYASVPFISSLLSYRMIARRKMYADKFLDFLGTDGRVHATFNQHVAETGRLSMDRPPLHQIPRAEEGWEELSSYSVFSVAGALIRSAFSAAEGHLLASSDYSQAEVRTLAHLAQEEFWINTYREGGDIHWATARAIYGPDATKEDRQRTKKTVFGRMYGGGVAELARQAGIPVDDMSKFLDAFDAALPNVRAWSDKQIHTALTESKVRSLFGRLRRFAIVLQNNRRDVEKDSLNFPVQSTASDANTLAAIRLWKKGVTPTLLVHDSVTTEVEEKDAEEVAELIASTQVEVGQDYMDSVVWKADPKASKFWAPRPDLERVTK
jgi:DNA polymerase-1